MSILYKNNDSSGAHATQICSCTGHFVVAIFAKAYTTVLSTTACVRGIICCSYDCRACNAHIHTFLSSVLFYVSDVWAIFQWVIFLPTITLTGSHLQATRCRIASLNDESVPTVTREKSQDSRHTRSIYTTHMYVSLRC